MKETGISFHKHMIKAIDEVVFAWGNHKQVKDSGMDIILKDLFPNAKALGFNKNGSPKHPLFVRADTKPVPFTNK